MCVCEQRAVIVLAYRVFKEGNWLYCRLWHANFWDNFSYTRVRCLIAGSTPRSAPPVTHTVCPVRAVASPASGASRVLTLKGPLWLPEKIQGVVFWLIIFTFFFSNHKVYLLVKNVSGTCWTRTIKGDQRTVWRLNRRPLSNYIYFCALLKKNAPHLCRLPSQATPTRSDTNKSKV